MKTITKGLVFVAFCAAQGVSAPQNQDKAELALKAAMDKEVMDGNLKAAIEQYRKIAADYRANRQVAAEALVHMGQCYEKLGEAEARGAYERVVRAFGDQKDAVATANVRLGKLGKAEPKAGPATRVVTRYSDSRLSAKATSPDGRYLLQDAGWEGLSLRDLGTGQTRALSKGWTIGARFSQDGSRIAFMRWMDGTSEAWIVAPDGSGLKKLWQGEKGMWAFVNSWFPDNKRFLVEIWLNNWNSQLIAISAPDGSVAKLWEGARPGRFGSLSPDGKYVVFNDRISLDPIKDELRLLSLADLSDTLLLSDFGPAEKANWMPDGAGLVFLSDRRKPGEARDLWYLAVANGKAQGRPQLVKADLGNKAILAPITKSGALYYTQEADMREVLSIEIDPIAGKAIGTAVTISGQGAGLSGQGVYSPDGHWLVYHRGDPSVDVLRNLETGEEKSIVPGFKVWEQTWFPDSRSLLVHGCPPSESCGLYRVDVATGAPKLLKEGSFGAASAVSPDGKVIYYSQRREGDQTRVMAWETETGKEHELMRGDGMGPGQWIAIDVSPDGQQVATGRVDGNEHIIEIQPSAGGARREVYRVRDHQSLGDIHWTRDGRYLIFSMGSGAQEDLWRIAVTAGSPQEMGITARAMGKISLHPDGRHIAYVASQGESLVMALENFLPKAKVSK